ncbi:MAG: hypothetical protein D6805_02225 [Planctomycetota bacterium]|nr:MAG: hypothetical protein D6805_02225 [Planctomycetota bacterium]
MLLFIFILATVAITIGMEGGTIDLTLIGVKTPTGIGVLGTGLYPTATIAAVVITIGTEVGIVLSIRAIAEAPIGTPGVIVDSMSTPAAVAIIIGMEVGIALPIRAIVEAPTGTLIFICATMGELFVWIFTTSNSAKKIYRRSFWEGMVGGTLFSKKGSPYKMKVFGKSENLFAKRFSGRKASLSGFF